MAEILNPAGAVPLSENELKLLQMLVYEECGMHFDERRTHFLADRLQRRIKACQLTSFYSYYRLLTSAEGRQELTALLENLAVNETSFFRNKPQLELFQKVILEEIAMYLDDPGHRLYEKLMESHFGEHPLSKSVLGSADSIRDLPRDTMANYFRQRYGPGNMVLAVTGRMNFDVVVKLAEKYMGDWPQVTAPRSQPKPQYYSHREDLTDPKLNRQYTMGMTPGPSAQDERRFAARVLSDVIGDADGSRFYWALVDNAIAEDADFGFYPHDGCGSFYIGLTTEPKRTEQALSIALKELERVKNDLTNDEVERAKNKIASGLVLSGEVPIGRMRSIGGQWIYTNEYRSLESDMDSLMKVTPASLQAMMREFPFDPMTIITLGPGEKDA